MNYNFFFVFLLFILVFFSPSKQSYQIKTNINVWTRKWNASNYVSNVGRDQWWKILEVKNRFIEPGHTWFHSIYTPTSPRHTTQHHNITHHSYLPIVTTKYTHIFSSFLESEALLHGANYDGGDRHRHRQAREEDASSAGRERVEEAERGARKGAQGKQGSRGADEARASERVAEAARGGGGRGEALLAARGARSGGSLPGTWLPRANRLPHGTALTRAEPPSEDRRLLHSASFLLRVIIDKNVLNNRFWRLHIRVIVAIRCIWWRRRSISAWIVLL